MPIDREPISFDFGIEETLDQGKAELLSVLHSDNTVSGRPEDVEEITKNSDNQQDDDQQDAFVEKPTSKTTPKVKSKKDKDENPLSKQKPPKAQDEEDVDENINLSELLQKDLLGIKDEEEEEEEKDVIEDDVTGKDTSKQKSKDEDESDESQDEEPIWTSLSKDLNRLGVFTPDEDEEGNEVESIATTPEEFKEKFVSEIRKGAKNAIDNFLSQFGEKHRKAFEAIYVKGVDPEQYFQTEAEITNFKDMDLTDEVNQERVVRKALKDQDFEDEDIEKEIARLKNYGDLETVSQRFHKAVVKKEEAKLTQLAAKKEAELQRQREIDEEYENNVYSVLAEKYKAKDYDGIPVNKQFAEKTMDYLTTKKFKLSSGELLTEFDKDILELKKPTNHSLKVKYAMILQLLKTDPTLSTIKKRAISQESNEVFQQVARNKTKKVTSGVVKPKTKSFFD